MPNIFKKISRGTNNLFKKVDHGASRFFNKLPAQINNIGGQIKNGLNQGLDGISDTARKVGNSLEKYAAPIVNGLAIAGSVVAPEFSPLLLGAAAASQKALTSATTLSHAIQTGANNGKAQVNQLAQTMNNKTNKVLGQAQTSFANTSSNLQSQANNALMNARNNYNGAIQNGAQQLTFH